MGETGCCAGTAAGIPSADAATRGERPLPRLRPVDESDRRFPDLRFAAGRADFDALPALRFAGAPDAFPVRLRPDEALRLALTGLPAPRPASPFAAPGRVEEASLLPPGDVPHRGARCAAPEAATTPLGCPSGAVSPRNVPRMPLHMRNAIPSAHVREQESAPGALILIGASPPRLH